ncbi:MAG: uncharacterized protein QOJ13_3723 [Gaiellales bacterium]|nr:uncharacterized protein [Gaiellales bacterium]MDX6594527.1 uncharacterized protein [Gaiellales bacterium]
METPELLAQALRPISDEIGRLRPGGAHVIESHAHLGLDEDGMSLDPEGLHRLLDQAEVHQALVFPLHDPERSPAYRVPNDRVLAWAGESEGRFVPFCRLDPAEDPIREAERCLAAGAKGIKLHPRAQAFGLVAGGVPDIFALAEQANVPILIHAGRGLPPTFGAELVSIAQRHPGARLILAHLGVTDQGVLAEGLRGHPGAVYDTSWLNPTDMLGLFARVPAERVVFGSDPPYGRTLVGLYLILRVAASLGLDGEMVRDILGRTTQDLIDGQPLREASPPRAPELLVFDHRLARIHTGLMMSFGAIMAGNVEMAVGMLELAAAATRDPAPGDAAIALERIAKLLETALALVTTQDESGASRPALQAIVLAMTIAATEVPQRRP